MHEPREVLRILGQRHFHDLGDYRQHLIAAICVGWSPKAMAASGKSERTWSATFRRWRSRSSIPPALSPLATSCAPGPSCTTPAALCPQGRARRRHRRVRQAGKRLKSETKVEGNGMDLKPRMFKRQRVLGAGATLIACAAAAAGLPHSPHSADGDRDCRP